MSDSLVYSKDFYYSRLCNLLSVGFYKGIKKIYNSVKNNSNVMESLQFELQSVTKWNTDKINNETQRIVDVSNYDKLLELLTACIYTSTKILLHAKGNKKRNKKINITIPKLSTFVHDCYKSIARQLWMNPQLLSDRDLSAYKIQKNFKLVQDLITESVKKTIETYIPLNDIIENYTDESDSDTDSDLSDEYDELSNVEDENINEQVNEMMREKEVIKKNNIEHDSDEEELEEQKVEQIIKENGEPHDIHEEQSDKVQENLEQNEIETEVQNQQLDNHEKQIDEVQEETKDEQLESLNEKQNETVVEMDDCAQVEEQKPEETPEEQELEKENMKENIKENLEENEKQVKNEPTEIKDDTKEIKTHKSDNMNEKESNTFFSDAED